MPKKQFSCLGLLTSADPGNPSNQAAQIDFFYAQNNLTLAQALQAPQLSRLRRDAPQETSEALTRALAFYANQLNIPAERRLNALQLLMLAEDMLRRYWELKFDELVYVLREGIAGRWGKIYQVLDAMTVHGWMQTYIDTERGPAVEQKSYEDARQRQLAEVNYNIDRTPEQQAQFEAYIEKLKVLTQAPTKEEEAALAREKEAKEVKHRQEVAEYLKTLRENEKK